MNEEIEEPKTATMRRVCGWCKCELEPIPCVPRMAHLTSHGICDPCGVKIEDELMKIPLPPAPGINPIAIMIIVALACLAWAGVVHHYHLFNH